MINREKTQALGNHELQRQLIISYNCYLARDSSAWKGEGSRRGGGLGDGAKQT